MPVPPSVTKINKNGVQFISSVDRASYTIKELCRGALRDVGKFVCREFKQAFYSHFKKKTGIMKRFTQYWVQYKYEEYPVLLVGFKPKAFYGGFQELGTSEIPKMGLLSAAVQDNIPEIIRIESQYLSALEDEARALSLISEDDYEGGEDE